MSILAELLKSKRFQAVIAGVVFTLVSKHLPGVTEDQVQQVVMLVSAWILGETVRPVIAPATSVSAVKP